MLLILLQLLSAPADSSAAPLRAAVATAREAVAGDSVVAVARRWDARLARDPRDHAARLGLASLARFRYAYGEADRRYARLQSLAHDDRLASMYARLGHALGLGQRWRRPAADRALLAVAEEALDLGDGAAAAEALGRAATLAAESDVALADSLARAAAAAVGDARADVRAHWRCARANLLYLLRPALADSLLATAFALLDAAGAPPSGACRSAQAVGLGARGRLRQADSVFRSLDSVAVATHDDYWLADIRAWRAFYNVESGGRLGAARHLADSALVLARRSGNVRAEAHARLSLGRVALRLGDHPLALHETRASAAILRRILARNSFAQVAYTQGEAAWLDRRYAEAERAFREGAEAHARSGARARVPLLLLRLAGVRRAQGDLDGAAELLGRTSEAARAVGDTVVLQRVHFERAMQRLARRDWGGAVMAFDAAEATGTFRSPARWDLGLRRAEALAGAGRLDEAEAELERTYAVLDTIRARLDDRDALVALLQSRRVDFDLDLGAATLAAQFAAAGRVEPAFRLAESARARRLQLELVRRLALDEAGGDVATVPPLARIPTLDALRRALPDGTALAEYLTGRGDEPTLLFLVQRDGVTTHRLRAADSLEASLGRYTTLLAGGLAAASLSSSLGLALVAPLGALPREITRLVVVPDGPLHRLPFAALALPAGDLVLDRFAISVAPSAAAALLWWTTSPRALAGPVVAFGDAAYAGNAGLPRLPASGEEARHVARLASGGRAYLGADASEASLRRTVLRPLDVLHLATHARVARSGIAGSAIYLAPGKGQDGRLGVEEIARLPLDAGLVVLSACRTADGALVTGEGVQGLTTTFLEAGARAVVATYWDVGDRAIGALMRAYYDALRRGGTAASAARAAQRTLRSQGASPAVWAGVMVAGDGASRPFGPAGRDAVGLAQ
jgi:tetratricopeptide (TPR) repeat protein